MVDVTAFADGPPRGAPALASRAAGPSVSFAACSIIPMNSIREFSSQPPILLRSLSLQVLPTSRCAILQIELMAPLSLRLDSDSCSALA